MGKAVHKAASNLDSSSKLKLKLLNLRVFMLLGYIESWTIDYGYGWTDLAMSFWLIHGRLLYSRLLLEERGVHVGIPLEDLLRGE